MQHIVLINDLGALRNISKTQDLNTGKYLNVDNHFSVLDFKQHFHLGQNYLTKLPKMNPLMLGKRLLPNIPSIPLHKLVMKVYTL